MPDHSELATAELDDAAIAEFATGIFDNHITNCPRCTVDALCPTGAELRLIKIEANDDTLEDGSDVTSDAMAKAWAILRGQDRHPMAPNQCPDCKWCNTDLMNYGSPEGGPIWLCHGCAARRIRGEAPIESPESPPAHAGIERIREALMPLGIFGNSNDPDLIVAVIGGFVEQYQAEQGALQEALESLGRQDENYQRQLDALYTERTRLVVALAGLCRLMGYDAGMRDDPAAIAPWKRVLLVDVPDMPSGSFQASWHIGEKDLALCAHLPEFPRPWNGHTTGEKYERLRRTSVAMGTSVITPDQQEELIDASESDRARITKGLFAKALRTGLEHANALHVKDLTIARLEENNAKLAAAVTDQSREVLKAVTEPIPIRITCPECGELHIDEGEFETKPHHTHACQGCGNVWRPSVRNTIGVRFLPGFKNDTSKPWFERMADALTKPADAPSKEVP